jgi:hypothetical protein
MWRVLPSPKLRKFQEGYKIFRDACTHHIYQAIEEIKVPERLQLFCFFGSATPCASPPLWPSIFPIILFGSTTLSNGMTGISFRMQWPLTSQSQGRLLQFFQT